MLESHRSGDTEDDGLEYKSSCPVHKRPANKVPTPVRPVSMVNNVTEMPKERSIEEHERNRGRTRSSSVSNRNRRRPSPPPLDRVLQIQATDKILNKNEVYKDDFRHESPRDDRVRVHEGFKNQPQVRSKHDSASNIVISSGRF